MSESSNHLKGTGNMKFGNGFRMTVKQAGKRKTKWWLQDNDASLQRIMHPAVTKGANMEREVPIASGSMREASKTAVEAVFMNVLAAGASFGHMGVTLVRRNLS